MIATLISAFLLAAIASELPVRGRKLQSRLFLLLCIHAVALLSVLFFLNSAYGLCPASILIFWAGAFLTWFGVRSHLESSILLRMLSFLRTGPHSKDELLRRYASHDSTLSRTNELVHAGLLQQAPDGFSVTSKGRLILRLAAFFGGPSAEKKTV